MIVTFQSDFPVTDAACKKATRRTLKEWATVLASRDDLKTSRRDAIQWMYDDIATKDAWWPTTIWVEYERAQGVVNRKDGLAEGFNICVTKTITADIATVFKAWTTVPLLKQWFGKGIRASAEDGGTWDDGDGHRGVFTRVRPNKDLRFTWEDSTATCATLVDVVFSDKGKGKTGLTLQHQRIQNRPEADGLRAAWGIAFDSLKNLCEA